MRFRATHTFTPSSHALRTPLLLAKRNERDILYEAPTQVRGSHGSALPPPSLRLLPAVASTLVSLVLAPFALHSHLVVVQLAGGEHPIATAPTSPLQLRPPQRLCGQPRARARASAPVLAKSTLFEQRWRRRRWRCSCGGEEPLSGGPSLPSTGRAHAAGGAVERRSGGARAVASRELQLGVRVRVG